MIPGYQPVEKLGRCPSYGAWLRALQTRLDRRVLLKVLPDASAEAQRYFSREIQVLVQLDGHGALRVIDEGTAGPVRYLVVDEADGVPLVESEAPHWAELARTCESLYRRVGELGFVLLPLAPEAFRRLPSAHYALADLGFLIPVGDVLPKIPSIPPDLVNTPAQPSLNARFLAATLLRLTQVYPGCPSRLRKAVTALDRRAARDVGADPLATQPLTQASAPVRPMAPLLVVAAVLLVASPVLWLSLRTPSEPRDSEASVSGRVPSSSNGEVARSDVEPPAPAVEPPPTESEQAEAAARAAREREADQRYGEIAGEETGLLPLNILDAPRREQLAGLRESYGDTEAARRAALWLSLSEAAAADEAWNWWIGARARCQASLNERDYAATMEELGRGPLRSLPPGLVAEKEAMEAALRSAELAARIETEGRLLAWSAARDYRSARQAIEDLVPRMTGVGKAWADDWRTRLDEESLAFEAAARDLDGAENQVLEATASGSWVAARDRIASVAGLDRFPELQARAGRWIRWLDRAALSAGAITEGLTRLKAANKNITFELVNEDEASIRGRVQSLDSATRFTVDVDGKVGDRSLSWRSLRRETLTEVVGTDPRATGADLVWILFLLGERSRALAEAANLAPEPEWLPEARSIEEQARRAQVLALLTEGDRLLAAGKSTELLRVFDMLDRLMTKAERLGEQARLGQWLSAYYRAVGPAVIFEGASAARFEGGFLELEYDFKNEGALADWQVGDGRSKAELPRKGAALIRGSVFLAPASTWKDPRIGVDTFEGDLEVQAELQATEVSAPPNLNVVLFSSLPLSQRRGLLFGLGFQPPRLHEVTLDDDRPRVLLPANVIGSARDLEGGDGSTFAEIKPKVIAGRVVELIASSQGDICALSKDKARVKECPNPLPNDQRRGTVEFRTYDSMTLVRSIEIRGRVRADWWSAWIERQVSARINP